MSWRHPHNSPSVCKHGKVDQRSTLEYFLGQMFKRSNKFLIEFFLMMFSIVVLSTQVRTTKMRSSKHIMKNVA